LPSAFAAAISSGEPNSCAGAGVPLNASVTPAIPANMTAVKILLFTANPSP